MPKLVLVFLILLLPLACGKQSPTELSPSPTNAPKPEAKAETQAPANGWLRTSIEPLPEANRYTVRLSWTRPEGPSEAWAIHRSHDGEPTRPIARLSASTTEMIDANVAAGQTYRYTLNGVEETRWRAWGDAEVTIPVDLEVKNDRLMTSLRNVRRLFLRKGARLFFESTAVRIDVDEVIAEDAIVAAFAPEKTAPSGTDGRAGGSFVLRARTGQGRLIVLNNGENGGEGLRGSIGPSGNPGRNGENARLQKIYGPYDVDPANAGLCRMWESTFYTFSQTRKLPPGHPEWRGIYRCGEPGTSGGPGTAGYSGLRGATGGKGGNAGSVLVDIPESDAIRVEASVVPGVGGRGGEGGPGGPGGPGGLPGARDPYGICPVGLPGPAGAAGGIGAAGDAGAVGLHGPVCIRVKSLRHGDCAALEALTPLSK